MLPAVSAVQGSAEHLAERSSIPAAKCASASVSEHSASPAASSSGASQSAAATTTQPFTASRVTQQLEASTSGRSGSGIGFGSAARERGEQRTEPLVSGGSVRAEAKRDQRQVADKLIAVFQERESDGWRRLIASSQLWPTLADGCAPWLRGSSGKAVLAECYQASDLSVQCWRVYSKAVSCRACSELHACAGAFP